MLGIFNLRVIRQSVSKTDVTQRGGWEAKKREEGRERECLQLGATMYLKYSSSPQNLLEALKHNLKKKVYIPNQRNTEMQSCEGIRVERNTE